MFNMNVFCLAALDGLFLYTLILKTLSLKTSLNILCGFTFQVHLSCFKAFQIFLLENKTIAKTSCDFRSAHTFLSYCQKKLNLIKLNDVKMLIILHCDVLPWQDLKAIKALCISPNYYDYYSVTFCK